MEGILQRIARAAGHEDLLQVLSERLAPADLGTLLQEVALRRAAARTTADLVRQWRDDRFVRPSPADPRVMLEIDRAAFDAVPAWFTPIELSPLSPLGCCSVVATVSQRKIVAASRAVEVASDPTNVLALECARRRMAKPDEPVHLCASHRVVRAQGLARPEHTAHFRLFVTVSADRDRGGGRRFQERALTDAIGAQLALLHALRARGFAVGEICVHFSADARHAEAAARAGASLRSAWSEVGVEHDPARIEASGYYQGVCFRVDVRLGAEGDVFPLGDGGQVDWTAQLTSNRRERMLIGAIGSELLAKLFAPSNAG